MLDKLRGAVMAAKRRKESHGLKRSAEEYMMGQTFTAVVKVGGRVWVVGGGPDIR